MSGGTWEYKQYFMTEVIENIKRLIEKNGKLKTSREMQDERSRDPDWYEKYPEDKFHTKYSDEVIEEFKKSIKIIFQAQTYIQRIDYLLAGDDSEESFIRRLKEDLNES